MKLLLLTLFLIHSAHAAEMSVHDTSLFIIILFMFLLLISIYAFFIKKSAKKEELLQEKEKKITWLRQVHAEDEHRHFKNAQETEKEIIALKHTIADLERKLQEGTKNQVVAKIEALQKKRQSASHS
jgi:Tfp pilus assembly protein PilO